MAEKCVGFKDGRTSSKEKDVTLLELTDGRRYASKRKEQAGSCRL